MQTAGFKKIDGIVVYVLGTKVIILATPKKGQKIKDLIAFSNQKKVEEVSTYELIKLWPHGTHAERRRLKTEPLLEQELQKRGRILIPQGGKMRWLLPTAQEC